ncbi:helix-turn-helix domain-containing protein [Listeria monocytogenes]|uniref:helix-turn-helix domain-containing protein n=1 Tax=Listeria monocytogenes TaxID=1639 RepID=UPI001F26705B|nr:helix-turn-helix transcriptional regulator [Listeria monocytogenes]UIJ50306.1 helix-turn-helix transcriptional regulator [Listeria monocytogenes]
MNNVNLISDRIIFFINQKNLTINRLATLADIPGATLNDLVNKKGKTVKLDTLTSICPILGISVTEFLDFPPYNEVEK